MTLFIYILGAQRKQVICNISLTNYGYDKERRLWLLKPPIEKIRRIHAGESNESV